METDKAGQDCIVNFQYMPVSTPPDISEYDGTCIAFVSGEGFQSCKYYSGSKTWKSLITNKQVYPTSWLKLIKQ